MTTEMIDKGVTSFRFNERKKRKKYLIGFLIDFNFCRLPRNDVRLGSQCSCHVRSSVNYVCVWSTKKLTMPAYCVAANCNNLQTTPGITMHELLLSQPAARRKWIKLIQFKQAFLLRHITPICVVSTSVSVISQNHGIPHVKADTMFRYSFKILPDACQTDTAVSLWVSRAKYQCCLQSSSWPICSDSPEWRSRHMVTWFGRHGDAFGTTENAFFRAFITLRPQFHLHHHSHQALTKIVSKITPNLGLVLCLGWFLTWFLLKFTENNDVGEIVIWGL